MLRAASRWIAAGGDAAEHDGAAVLREMERRGGWKLFEEEEATAVVAADVAGSLVTVVLEEVVDELMCME
ncbi:hypothetical protein AXF42_Ash006017 [Apostasia shenzhenica]|uniref:Uncharacterized protein n=1 Tax=Apostasia shenzhenica TaxID=1088818 RepID=A0A2I0B002_9ASPA|nr:hypothetical protein AXF42_Ash006017 [Apostasia shenzhenica]